VQSQVGFNRAPEKVPEKAWCRARSGSTGFRRRFWRRSGEALVQSQVRFNRVAGKVAEKVPEKVRFNTVPGKVPEKAWEALEHAELFPALGFAARFGKICKNKSVQLLGIPPKLIVFCKRPFFADKNFSGSVSTLLDPTEKY